jgi:hypothetical protein
MTMVQTPPTHWSALSQHFCVALQASSIWEHVGGTPQVPFVQ